MVYGQPRILDAQISLGFWDTNGSSNLDQMTRSSDRQQKVNFAVPADHRIKLKDSEKKDFYQDLAKVQKKLWNIKETGISIVIGTFSTVNKDLLQRQKDLEKRKLGETIKTRALLRSARILRRVLETWGDLLSHRLQRKNICWRCCEKLERERERERMIIILLEN